MGTVLSVLNEPIDYNQLEEMSQIPRENPEEDNQDFVGQDSDCEIVTKKRKYTRSKSQSGKKTPRKAGGGRRGTKARALDEKLVLDDDIPCSTNNKYLNPSIICGKLKKKVVAKAKARPKRLVRNKPKPCENKKKSKNITMPFSFRVNRYPEDTASLAPLKMIVRSANTARRPARRPRKPAAKKPATHKVTKSKKPPKKKGKK